MGDKPKPVGLLDCLHFAWTQTDDNGGLDPNIRHRDVIVVGFRIVVLALPVLISAGIFHMLLLNSSPYKNFSILLLVSVSIFGLVGLDLLAKRMQQLSESCGVVVACMWALAGCAARSQFSSISGMSWGFTFCAPQLAITLLRLPCRTTHAALLAHLVADTSISLAGASFSDAKAGGEAVALNMMANIVFFFMCLFESYSFEVTMKTAEKAQDNYSQDGGSSSELLLVDRLLVESCDCVVYTDASVTMNVLRGTPTLEDLFGEKVDGQPLLCRAKEVKHSMKLVQYVRDILEEVRDRTTPYMPPGACMELSFQHSSGNTFQTSLLAVWLPPHNDREACLAIGFRRKPSPDETTAFLPKQPMHLPIAPKADRKTSFSLPPEDYSSTSRPQMVPEDPKENFSQCSATSPSPAPSVTSQTRTRNLAQVQQQRADRPPGSVHGSVVSSETSESHSKAGTTHSSQPPIKLSLAESVSQRGQEQEQAPVGVGERQPSVGSRGHPHNCAPACKFVNGAKGCKDGDQCLRCHLCKWKKTRAKAEKKEEQSQDAQLTAADPMTVSTPTFAKTGATGAEQYQNSPQAPEFANRGNHFDPGYMGAQNLPPHMQVRRGSGESTSPSDIPSRINSFVGTMVSGTGSGCGRTGGPGPAYITLHDTGEFRAGSDHGGEDSYASSQMYRSLAQLDDPRVKKKNTFLHCDTSSILSTKNRICVSSMSDPGVSAPF